VGVDDAHVNGDCYRSAAVDRLDEHVSATHLGIDAETLHDETVSPIWASTEIVASARKRLVPSAWAAHTRVG
jgi:hypothetical protein